MIQPYDFQIGDIVLLKSGSPDLTVESVAEDGHLICTWFVDGVKEATDFVPETLILRGKIKIKATIQ